MVQLFLYIWMAAIPLILAGCGVGPSMMRADRLTYNDAIQFTERQELLLNIVRLRYNEGPEFLATNSISTQFTLDLGAAAGANVGDDQQQRTNLFNIGGAIGYSERPTITFTPRNEKEFTQQLISPIELEVIFLLINYGWEFLMLKRYREGKLSLGLLARKLDVSISEAIDMLAELGVESPLDAEDYLKGLEVLGRPSA